MKVDATYVLSHGMKRLRLLCDKVARPHVVATCGIVFLVEDVPIKKDDNGQDLNKEEVIGMT